MIARLISGLLAIIWFVLGLFFLVVAVVLLAFWQIPCSLASRLCASVQEFVFFDMLYGQVNQDSTGFVIGVVTLLSLWFGGLLLFGSFQQIRFSLWKDRSEIMSFSPGLGMLVISTLLFLTVVAQLVVPRWTVRTACIDNADCDITTGLQPLSPEEAAANAVIPGTLRCEANGICNRDGLLAVYYQISQVLPTLTAGTAIVLFVLQGLFLVVPITPPAPVKKGFLSQANQCTRCGLQGDDDRVPVCVLCKGYVQLEILNQGDVEAGLYEPGYEWELIVQISPLDEWVPLRELMVTLDAGQIMDFQSVTPATWHVLPERRRSGQTRLTGPDYIKQPEILHLYWQVNDRVRQQWRQERQHVITVQVGGQADTNQQSKSLLITVRRPLNWFERRVVRVLNLLNRGTQRGWAMVRDQVERWRNS